MPPQSVTFGSLTIGIQIVFIRILLEIFHGNELTIGLALSVWLIGTAAGSTLVAKFIKQTGLFSLTYWILFPVLFLDYLFIKFTPKIFHLIPGVIPSLSTVLMVSSLTILPPAFLMGIIFPFLVEKLGFENRPAVSSRVTLIYLGESIGSFAGALLLNFVLFHKLNSIQIVGVFIVFFFLPVIFRSRDTAGLKTVFSRAPAILYTLLGIILIIGGPQFLLRLDNYVYAPYSILTEKDTPYGNIKIARLEEQTVLLRQGKILYSTPDPFTAESRMLFPLLTHPGPESVLILGGNLYDYLPYLNRVSAVKNITFVELDPVVTGWQQERIRTSDYREDLSVKFITSDVRRFLTLTSEKYDVICLNYPEPSTLNLNRLYTRNFFRLIQRCLRPGGMYFYTIQSSENYLNEPLAEYVNLHRNSLQSVFKFVYIIPGDENHFLASDVNYFSHLPSVWEQRLSRYHLKPVYITPVYLLYRLSADRMESFREQLNRAEHHRINTDFNLRGYFYYFRVWSRVSGKTVQTLFHFLSGNKTVTGALLVIFCLFFSMLFKPGTPRFFLMKLFFIGGISISLEIIVLLEYQILFGTLYDGIALVFGLFMLGLAGGAYCTRKTGEAKKYHARLKYAVIGFLSAGLMLFLPAEFEWQIIRHYFLFQLVQLLFIPLIIFLVGWLTGLSFALLTALFYGEKSAGPGGLTYGIDLAGAVVGSVLTPLLIIPLFGVPGGLLFLLLITGFQLR